MTSTSNPSFKCEFCGKSFRREKSLMAHACEQKRRHQQEKEIGVQFGYRAYKRFYEMTQNKKVPPSYDEFCKSQYYLAFVKFGRHIKMIRALKPERFIDWVIKENKKLDKWCTDKVYEDYLHDTIRKENPNDTLQRAFTEMIDWGDKEGAEWNHYFKYAAPNRVVQSIIRGSISPWVLYNCDSGLEFLGKLNEEQLGFIFEYIDPDYWTSRFGNYVADAEYIKDTLKEAGL